MTSNIFSRLLANSGRKGVQTGRGRARRRSLLASASYPADRVQLRRSSFAAAGIGLYALTALSAPQAHANPAGGTVVAGSASIGTSTPGTTDIVQSTGKAIINWQSFGIGAGETVNFIQPDVKSVTLNRVIGQDPSAIFGNLNANGTVMLVNPNGVIFGPTARIDVGSLVATTANISNSDFMAGRYIFDQASPNANARIVNQGQISIRDSGLAALVAPSVENSGSVHARLGSISLAGAQSFTLDFQGDGMLSFDAGSVITRVPTNAGDALVVNTGVLSADGGSIELSAHAVRGVIDNVINTSGVIAANSVGSRNGVIVLSGGDNAVAISGAVGAAGVNAGETGGKVVATGHDVAVASDTVIDTSGRAGGGQIALGSDGTAGGAWAAGSVSLAAGAVLNADAIDSGDGGSVTLLSDQFTHFDGDISAVGGANGGDGGFVEVSSHQDVSLTGSVDLRAARGATGNFLIDPVTITITDNTAPTNNGNTVSRGWLEAQAGNSNIALTATGLITINAMAGHLINLQTQTGSTFTLQSTTSGGIKFDDAATEIRTAGGNIALYADGIGATLSNIGKLTSNGGSITLRANGNVDVAGDIAAGTGAVAVQSVIGSINAENNVRISGGSVALKAVAGNIGAGTTNDDAVLTGTTNLNVETGGDFNVSNNQTLDQLAITLGHAGDDLNTYRLESTGLSFDVTDSQNMIMLGEVNQPGLSSLSFTGDKTLSIGTVNAGTGSVSINSLKGNITGNGSITGGALTLTASGSTGANGAIGTPGDLLDIDVATVTATAGTGGIYLGNYGALTLSQVVTTGELNVQSAGNLTVGNVSSGGSALTLKSTGGDLLDDGNAATNIVTSAYQVTLGAAQNIGTTATPFTLNATGSSSIDASANSGSIAINVISNNDVYFGNVAANGPVALGTSNAGSTTFGNISTSGTTNTDISLRAENGVIYLGNVYSASNGNVDVVAANGAIEDDGSWVNGNVVNLTALGNGNGVGSDGTIYTEAKTLNISATGDISVRQTGTVTLGTIATTQNNDINIRSVDGDITVGSVTVGGSSGSITIRTSNGDIIDDGVAATGVFANDVTLRAAKVDASASIGTSSDVIHTAATQLDLRSSGNLFVTNDLLLTDLSIENSHGSATANTLQLTSPYITFDVTDDGTAYHLNKLVGPVLSNLSFTGDNALIIGDVQAVDDVHLTSGQGNIVEDGNANTRITGGSVSLAAEQGAIGTSTASIGVDTSNLELDFRDNVYVADISDLGSLSITHRHNGAPNAIFSITAPSLTFNLVDSADGYALNDITDVTGLSFEFSGDRTINVGRVNLTSGGYASLTTDGDILGTSDSLLYAGSVSLYANGDIGSSTTPLSVRTDELRAQSYNGDVRLVLPSAAGSTTNTVKVDSIYAYNGLIDVRQETGDLALQTLEADGPISLTVDDGSILADGYWSGNYTSNYSSLSSNDGISLTASGSIGSDTVALQINNAPSLSAIASADNGNIHLSLSNYDTTNLNGLSANGVIDVAAEGDLILDGAVNGRSGAVRLVSSSGSITGAGLVRGDAGVTLSAYGSLGSSGTALNTHSTKLDLTSGRDIIVDNDTGLSALSLTSTGYYDTYTVTAEGLDLSLSDDGIYHLAKLSNATALDFSFTGNHGISIGAVDAGANGSVAVTTSYGNITNDGSEDAAIAAGTVALTAAYGSIGATGAGNAIELSGTTDLSLGAFSNFFVNDDTSLQSLALNVGNGYTNSFAITAPDQSFTINGGTYNTVYVQSIANTSGSALNSFSLNTAKNINVGAISLAGGTVDLTTTAGSITSDSGSGRITAAHVTLGATGNTSGGGVIGASGNALRLSTADLTIANNSSIYVADNVALSNLDITSNHRSSSTGYANSYSITGTNLTFSASDNGTTVTLSNVVTPGDFSFSTDRALQFGTVTASSTGTASLTSTGAVSNGYATITGTSGSNAISAGTVVLSAKGYRGSVGTSGVRINTHTNNLAVGSAGDVYVANSAGGGFTGTLASLSLDLTRGKTGSSYTYQVAATNLTSADIGYDNNYGLRLNNITSSTDMALSVTSDSTISIGTINTGRGGSVSLAAEQYNGSYYSYYTVQGQNSASTITTGALDLTANSVGVYNSPAPLLTSVDSLSGNISGSMILSNDRTLTLHDLMFAPTNSYGSTSADIRTTGAGSDLLFDGDNRVNAQSLSLTASGSIGSASQTMLTDAAVLTLDSAGDIRVDNAADLSSLSIINDHGTIAGAHTINVTAHDLTLDITDDGAAYSLNTITDGSGLNFAFTGDNDVRIGSVIGGDGRYVSLTSAAGDLTRLDTSQSVVADTVSLSAGGSIGVAGTDGAIETTARSLNATTGADAYLYNTVDLSQLSLTSTYDGAAAQVFQITAPQLTFDVTDDGNDTTIGHVTDATGLNFSLTTLHRQSVDTIDLPTGNVSLASYHGIVRADADELITAAGLSLSNLINGWQTTGAAIGASGEELNIAAPRLSVRASGDVQINSSDVHIDTLSFETVTLGSYTGDYSITAPGNVFSGNQGLLDTVTDDGTGLNFSYVSDAAVTVDNIDLGTTGSVSLSVDGTGSIAAVDPASTLTAGRISLSTNNGSVGTAAQAINTHSGALSVSQYGAGLVNLAIKGDSSTGLTSLDNISAYGDVTVAIDQGDIKLGSIYADNNDVVINNQGGSILSGSINNASSITLTAGGSIGNDSAIATSSDTGTTVITATAAANSRGATGSIAISSSDALNAASITGTDNVTLAASDGISVGSINAGSGAVSLSVSQGSITANNSSNMITGSSVTLDAGYSSSYSIGSSGNAIKVDAAELTLNTPGNIYVADDGALSKLSIDRSYDSGTTSSGTISVIAAGTTFSATDNGASSTLSNLTSSGLDFTYNSVDAIVVNTIDVGSAGSVNLAANSENGNGSITAANSSAKITAGTATLSANSNDYYYGDNSSIGTSSTALGLAVGVLNASSGSGGIYVKQTGDIRLNDLSTDGAVSVQAATGNITLGSVSFGGTSGGLNLAATTGSILSGGGTLQANSSSAGIMLTAANGIGAAGAAVNVNADAGNTVAANVTGNGSLYLNATGSLNGGLTSAVANGATNVTASGSIRLANMNSATDAIGNDINVTTTGGDIIVGSTSDTTHGVTAGANNGRVTLTALNGSVYGGNNSGTNPVSGGVVNIYGAYNVGQSYARLGASGNQVQISSGGDVYLNAVNTTTYSSIISNGTIDISGSAAGIQLSNLRSNGGDITVWTGGDIIVGALNAGSGNVSLMSRINNILDDGKANTRIIGGDVSLVAYVNIGTASNAVQTTTSSLSFLNGTGDVYIDDNNTNGITVSASGWHGKALINTAGPTTLSTISALSDDVANDMTVTVANGDLTVGTVTGGATSGKVSLVASNGSILQGSGTGVTASHVSLSSTSGIGTLTDFTIGSGTAVKLTAGTIDLLKTTTTGSVINVSQTGAVTLNPTMLALADDGAAAYIAATGNIDATAGLDTGDANLALVSGGTLKLPSAGITTAGDLVLKGATDVVTGASGRTITADANSIVFSSGSSGGTTTLNSTTSTLDAGLTGTGKLVVNNTGAVDVLKLATYDGDIDFTGSDDVVATLISLGGQNRTASITATTGDLTMGTISGGTGTINLTASQGALIGVSDTSISTDVLNLTSYAGIGSDATPLYLTSVNKVGATVLGTGDIYLGFPGKVSLGMLTTTDGSINVVSAGMISTDSTAMLTAGNAGAINLESTGDDVLLGAALTTDGDVSISGNAITLAQVTTGGTQSYTAATTTIGGNLLASGIEITGNAALSNSVQLDTSDADGDISISGGLVGNGNAMVLKAGDGNITLGGAATGLGSMTATAGMIDLNGVTSTGAQVYNGETHLNGSYATSGTGFTVNGAALVDGTTSIATANGAVAFTDTVDGGHDLTINGGTGDVTFGNVVGGTTALGALVVNTGGVTSLGTVTAASVTTDAPGSVTLTGDVTTSGAQSYGEVATLVGNRELSGSTVSFGKTVTGTSALTVDGDAVFGGAVSLASLDVSGTTSLGADVTTTGMQNYGDDVTLAGNATLTGGTVTFDGGVIGAHNLAIVGNAIFAEAIDAASLSVSGTTSLAAGVTTTGTQSYTGLVTLGDDMTLAGSTVAFGAGVTGNKALVVDGNGRFAGSSTLASLEVTGTTRLDGGSITTTGDQSYDGAVTLGDDMTLAGSTVAFGAGVTGNKALVVDGNGRFAGSSTLASLEVTGATRLDGGSITTTGDQSYDGAVTLTGDTTLASGGDLAFNGTVDGGHDLTVNGGTGDVTFADAVGSTVALGDIVINSSGTTSLGTINAASVTTDAPGVLMLGGNVTTTGNQSYGEIATLSSDVVLSGPTVSFGKTVTGTSALTVDGDAVFGGAVSLASLDVGGTTSLGANVTTSGTQNYGDVVTLTNDLVLNGTTVALDAGVIGGKALTIDGKGMLAGDSTLASLNVTGATDLGGSVTTTGDQNFGGAVTLTGDTTLASGGDLAFNDTVDGGHDLTVNGGEGDVTFADAVGSTVALGDIVINSSGTTSLGTINAASVTTDAPGVLMLGGNVTTTGNQSYGEIATLVGDLVLTGSTVSFGQQVDGDGALSIVGDGSFGDTVSLGALDVSGTTSLAAAVTTSGDQNYGGAVTLGDDMTLSGGTIGFGAGVIGGKALTIDGNGTLAGDSTLASLDVTGTTDLGGSVTTTGDIGFGGAVTLVDDVVLANGGKLAFNDTVDGGHDLTVNGGEGDVTFADAVGSATALGDIVINSSGTTSLGTINAASVTTDAPGVLMLGGNVTTTGNQSYGEVATLTGDLVLTGSTVSFGQQVNGDGALSIVGDGSFGDTVSLGALEISGAGSFAAAVTTIGAQYYGGPLTLGNDMVLSGSSVTLAGGANGGKVLVINGDAAFGGESDLASLEVSGNTRFTDATITTSGAQNYLGAVMLDGAATLRSLGDLIAFASTVDSSNASPLTVDAATTVRFAGRIGGSGPLGALIVKAGGDVDYLADVAVASLSQNSGGATHFQGAVTASGADGIVLVGNGFTFDQAVSATGGALSIENVADDAIIRFSGPVVANTGFTQKGGAHIYLPASVTVTNGGIDLGIVAELPDGVATITTAGDVVMPGLKGLNTNLTISAGTGAINIGSELGTVANGNIIQVATLTVPSAGSARLWGNIGTFTGPRAAQEVDSSLIGPPYYLNRTPWGPNEKIAQLAAVLVPHVPVPSAPGVMSLFNGAISSRGITPNALDAFRAPDILSISAELLPVNGQDDEEEGSNSSF